MSTRPGRTLSDGPSGQSPEGIWIALKALVATLVEREIITDDSLQWAFTRALRDLDARASDISDPIALEAAKKLIDTFRLQIANESGG
jgi:hypothetical protein